jgi:hypothetical protein
MKKTQQNKVKKKLTWSRAADEAGASLGGITFDTGIFSTAVLLGGVDLAGEGFGSLADDALSADNLALFARGTRSSSELLQKRE